MPIAVIADAHLGGPGGPPGPLVEQLDSLSAASCERLVLLGDLFHVWVALRRFETPDVRAVIEAIRRLRQRGVAVDYIEGNRDFFVRGGPYERELDAVGTELAFAAAGRRYLAIHGDGLDDRDYKYRFWRWLSKNRVSRVAAGLLPSSVASRIVHTTERELARTNFKHRVHLPREVIVGYAERRLREGHDAVIMGHFHESRRWAAAGGEVRIIDAWFRTRRLEWLTESGG